MQESGFFARDEPILGLGAGAGSGRRAFEHEAGRGRPDRCARRAASSSRRSSASRIRATPKLDEVKDRVRDEVVKQKARDAQQAKAAEIAAKLKSAPDFEKAAKAAGVEAKTTDLIAQDSPIPDLGVAPAVEDAAFKLPVGARQRSDPHRQRHRRDQGGREEGGDAAKSGRSSKDRFREELLTDRRNRFFSAYMVKAKQKLKIEVNREAAPARGQLIGPDQRATQDTKHARRKDDLVRSSSCVFVSLCLVVRQLSPHERERQQRQRLAAAEHREAGRA